MTLAGDVYRAILKGSAGLNECYNVFAYKVATVGGGLGNGAYNLGLRLDAVVLNALMPLISTGYSVGSLYIVNVRDPSDYYEFLSGDLTNNAGEIAGEGISTTVVLTYRFNRPNPAERHGFKRFSGIPEANVHGFVLTPAYKTSCQALTSQLTATLSGDGWDFTPVVEKTIIDPETGKRTRTPYGSVPPSWGVTTCQLRGVGTQASRKTPFSLQ